MDYDRTPLPEVFRAARTLPVEALDVWGRAIRSMVPAGIQVGRAVDLGCGTARFTRLLAEALNAPVVGVEPSLRMLGEREIHDPRVARFVAGTAEAIPLATATTDLVFLSMVYHHLRPGPALAEMRRILRPGGHLMVRTPTRETLDAFTYFAFFPEALAIDRARIPSREELIDACAGAGFTLRDHQTIRHLFATDHADSTARSRSAGSRRSSSSPTSPSPAVCVTSPPTAGPPSALGQSTSRSSSSCSLARFPASRPRRPPGAHWDVADEVTRVRRDYGATDGKDSSSQDGVGVERIGRGRRHTTQPRVGPQLRGLAHHGRAQRQISHAA